MWTVFPLRQTHFSLLSYFRSSGVPTLTYLSRFAWPLSHFLCSDSTTAQQELVSLFMLCSFMFDSLSCHRPRPGTLSGVNGTVLLGPSFSPGYSSSLTISYMCYWPPAPECSPPDFFIRQAGELWAAVRTPCNEWSEGLRSDRGF